MDNLPNVSPNAARKEAVSLVIVFAILFGIAAALHAGGSYLRTSEALLVYLLGGAVVFLGWLFGILVAAVLVFSLWDWWSDLRSCHRHGVEQNQITSGVPFMPGSTKP